MLAEVNSSPARTLYGAQSYKRRGRSSSLSSVFMQTHRVKASHKYEPSQSANRTCEHFRAV
eukprot:1663440-Amphidinium_carterae.1